MTAFAADDATRNEADHAALRAAAEERRIVVAEGA